MGQVSCLVDFEDAEQSAPSRAEKVSKGTRVPKRLENGKGKRLGAEAGSTIDASLALLMVDVFKLFRREFPLFPKTLPQTRFECCTFP